MCQLLVITRLRINQNDLNIEPVSTNNIIFKADVRQVAEVIPSSYLGHVTVIGDRRDLEVRIDVGYRESEQVVPECVVTSNGGKTVVPNLNISEIPLEIKEGSNLARDDVCVQVDESFSAVKELNNMEVEKQLVMKDICTYADDEDTEQLLNQLNELTDIIGDDITELRCTDKIEIVVEDLKTAGIVEDSKSPFASPAILDKTGEYCLGIDYRSLNEIAVKNHFPLPSIQEDSINLKKILEIKRNVKLTCLKTYTFLKTKGDYLGFTIKVNIISPGKNKMNCLKDFSLLRSFIWLGSYFRHFVKHFAIILKLWSKTDIELFKHKEYDKNRRKSSRI